MMLRVLSIFLVLAVGVYSHGTLVEPEPRQGTTNSDTNPAPCGGRTPGASVFCYGRDREYQLRWRIDADHGGTMQYGFDANGGEDFSDIGEPNIPSNSNPSFTRHTFTAETDNGVVQWRWDSNENQYYGCADVKVGPPMETLTIGINNYDEADFIDAISTLSGADSSLIMVEDVTGTDPTTVTFIIHHDAECEGSSEAADQLEQNLGDDAQVTAAGIDYEDGTFARDGGRGDGDGDDDKMNVGAAAFLFIVYSCIGVAMVVLAVVAVIAVVALVIGVGGFSAAGIVVGE